MSPKQDVIAIIPARYASTRLPGKPLIDLDGQSMIQRTYAGVKASTLIREAIVATDDQRILTHCRDLGIPVLMTDASHSNGTSRCAEIALQLKSAYVINVQGDEPLIQGEVLDQLISKSISAGASISTLFRKFASTENPTDGNSAKLVIDHNQQAMYFSRLPIPGPQFDEHLKHIGIYFFKREILLSLIKLAPTQLEQAESLEQLRWLQHGYNIHAFETSYVSQSVDVIADVERVIALLSS